MTDRHPKSEALHTAVALLDERAPDEITVERVLSESGVSTGSLFHHNRDFKDLLDRAQVQRFTRLVDASIAMIAQVVDHATTREERYAGSSR